MACRNSLLMMKGYSVLIVALCAVSLCGCTSQCDLEQNKLAEVGHVSVQTVKLKKQSFVDASLSTILADVFKNSNDRLSACGYLGIGLTTSGLDMQKEYTFDIPELTIYGCYEYIARQVGASVRYDEGRILMKRVESKEVLPK